MFNTIIPETIDFKSFLADQNQADLFAWYLNINPAYQFRNPLRNDPSASCYLEESNGVTLLWDWGDVRYKGKSIVQVIATHRNISYQDAIYYIINNYKQVNINTKPTKVRNSSFIKQIYPTARKWTKFDKDYWEQYNISKSQLDSDLIIPIDWYYTNFKTEPDRLQVIQPKHLTYGIPIKKRWKIYTPKIKFFDTNQKWNDIGGIESFIGNDLLIITKSYKDYRVLSNLGYNTRYILCETVNINTAFINYVSKEFKKIVFFMDNDAEGIKASERLTNESKFHTGLDIFKGIYLPEHLLTEGISDPADFIKQYGEIALTNQIEECLTT